MNAVELIPVFINILQPEPLNDARFVKTEGLYGAEGFIYQQLFTLPDFDDNYPVIGSWVIGGDPAGIGIREGKELITDNTSRFVPHLIA